MNYLKKVILFVAFYGCLEISEGQFKVDDTPLDENGQPMAVTPWGTYLGTTHSSSRQKRKYYAFTGIPYALAPVGDLRFKVSNK